MINIRFDFKQFPRWCVCTDSFVNLQESHFCKDEMDLNAKIQVISATICWVCQNRNYFYFDPNMED